MSKNGGLARAARWRVKRQERIQTLPFDQLSIKEKRDCILQEQGEVCDICKRPPQWNGKPLKFEQDHINGIRSDNRRENLRLICPSCHSQTETFKCRKNPNRYSDEELLDSLRNSTSIYGAIQKLGMNPHGSNYKRFFRLVIEHNITFGSKAQLVEQRTLNP